MSKSLPESSIIARHRVVEELSFTAIGKLYGVSRQAVHKSYKRWAEANGVEWKTRKTATPQGV